MATNRVVIGISGATGFTYAIRVLEILRAAEKEIHLIVSKPAEQTRAFETNVTSGYIKQYADHVYSNQDITAAIASGSYPVDGMVIVPCSVKMLGEIANGVSGNLISRAADVMLKEKRPLLLGVRETPFNRIHLDNMTKAHDAGAIIMPPVPAFYNSPQTLDDIIDDYAGRLCDVLGIDNAFIRRWR